jgi:hypothetical protein
MPVKRFFVNNRFLRIELGGVGGENKLHAEILITKKVCFCVH